MIGGECEVMRRMDVEMNFRAENAEKLFCQGYNCAQAVFWAFHDVTEGLNQETALRMMSSFGGGMGRLREVCGALTGLFAAVGILYGYSDPDDRESKAEHYRLIQELANRFKDEFGSILCRDLLDLEETTSDPIPDPRTQAYYQTRPCAGYIRFGAALLESLIKERQKD
jgi:C_GCAxxG_C_C family probable redox protein